MNERATTALDYTVKLARVVTWLADHLDDALDLARLADVARMSPFHFHRVYHAMQGETAAETVRRLRLHRSAVELILGEQPVSRIARRAGYGNQQAFTRVFSAAYGVPPARYRASFVPTFTSNGAENAMEITAYQAIIRDMLPIRVMALRHRGDYQTINTTFQRLSTIAAGQGVFGPTTRVFGIYYDDPSVTPLDELRSDACLAVPDNWTPSGEARLQQIRGGRYAVTQYVGPYAELASPYKWLYGTWLAQSGQEPAEAPCVEEYLNDARLVPPTELRTEIWLPL